jgi:hypothetical protein
LFVQSLPLPSLHRLIRRALVAGSSVRFAASAALVAMALSCSSKETLQPEGGTCALATDCEEGLVCIDGQCSSDLSLIQSTETEGGTEGGGMGTMMTPPPGDGSTPTSDATMSTEAGGSTPPDSGSPPHDSGSPPHESGTTPPMDSGSGNPPPDSDSSD